MGSITTTLVISFADPAAAAEENMFLSAEIDGRPDGLNKGITSFLIGDAPYFLVFRSAGLLLKPIQCTMGSANSAGSGILVKQVENITFTKTKEANLSKPPMGVVTWIKVGSGDGPSTPTLVAGTTLCTTPNPCLAVYQATYYAAAEAYRLSGVSGVTGVAEVAVVVFIEGYTV